MTPEKTKTGLETVTAMAAFIANNPKRFEELLTSNPDFRVTMTEVIKTASPRDIATLSWSFQDPSMRMRHPITESITVIDQVAQSFGKWMHDVKQEVNINPAFYKMENPKDMLESLRKLWESEDLARLDKNKKLELEAHILKGQQLTEKMIEMTFKAIELNAEEMRQAQNAFAKLADGDFSKLTNKDFEVMAKGVLGQDVQLNVPDSEKPQLMTSVTVTANIAGDEAKQVKVLKQIANDKSVKADVRDKANDMLERIDIIKNNPNKTEQALLDHAFEKSPTGGAHAVVTRRTMNGELIGYQVDKETFIHAREIAELNNEAYGKKALKMAAQATGQSAAEFTKNAMEQPPEYKAKMFDVFNAEFELKTENKHNVKNNFNTSQNTKQQYDEVSGVEDAIANLQALQNKSAQNNIVQPTQPSPTPEPQQQPATSGLSLS